MVAMVAELFIYDLLFKNYLLLKILPYWTWKTGRLQKRGKRGGGVGGGLAGQLAAEAARLYLEIRMYLNQRLFEPLKRGPRFTCSELKIRLSL